VRDNTFYLKADLPGIEPQEVELTVEGNQLTLKGERKAEHEAKEGAYTYREVRYGSFVRTFRLPEGVKAEDVQASYRNGVLDVSIPLPAEQLPKKVLLARGEQKEEHKAIDASH
jgi:HSP20 family protein